MDKTEFCLDVKLTKTFDHSPYMSVGASTSGRLDNHDIYSILLRYKQKEESKEENVEMFLRKARRKMPAKAIRSSRQ